MKDQVLEAYNKMALDYEKHVDTESGLTPITNGRPW